MPTLLLEIGCEELPAAACREAAEQLPSLCDQHLWRAPTQVHVGPRRIALHVEDMPEVDVAQWIKGPPVSVAFDAEGRPTKAAEGFARRHGQDVSELEERDGFLGALVAPKPLAERLAAIVQGFVFAKSMRWGPDLRFARPVRWLLAKLDAETVSLPVEGIPSGSATYGHRFLAGEIEIPNADAYTSALRAADVEPDAEARRRSIVEQLDEIGGWTDPAGVLEEVVYLAEWPVVLEGSFDERFLELPERVIQTAMQSHQRYFPLGGARFAFVANGGDSAVVRAGNDRVLEGRLEDASFTFERDVAAGIEELGGRLAVITFVAGAGSFADKTARLEQLVEALGGGEATREAARLAKADQAAELVREFPDLEGAIGAEYARLAGYPEAVCVAIEEQYLPDAAGGALPQTEGGRILAAADKIDTLTVAFALGQRPTGSRDPYGLRRAAIGLCRLAVDGGLEIDLDPLVKEVVTLLVEQGAEVRDDPSDVTEFVLERLEGMLDVPVEFVRAARVGAASDLGGIARLAETLAGHADSETFASVYTAHDRANRLAGKASDAASAFDPSLTIEPAEIELAEVLATCGPRIESTVGAGDFVAALEAAAKLGPPVDRFFDEVLVMADDAQVRANRLRLLLDVRDAIGALGDLSLIPR